ncbi:hypothetical protein DFH08DRAFT_1036759 [Mycena albidolilacea]|uniref:Uncharacterized protein n=1 Tax=Mycena albidolilacea TaxID=1033008 RepID=A0AAD6ZCY4_9AGAR|nr:hypothetical protein DFH08DRAFT_1036759 [Mycena albidolilacea]
MSSSLRNVALAWNLGFRFFLDPSTSPRFLLDWDHHNADGTRLVLGYGVENFRTPRQFFHERVSSGQNPFVAKTSFSSSSLSYDFAKFSGYTRRHGAPTAAGRVSARLQPHQPINRARPLVAAIWRPLRQRENLIFACFRPLPHLAVCSPSRPYAPTPWPLDCTLRYQHLTVLFWPDRRRNPRLGLPSHLALSCSCVRFPPLCVLNQLLSGTLRNIESLDSPLALFLFYGAAAPLFLLRNLAAPAALARAPRLAALRHCAAPLPPHPRFPPHLVLPQRLRPRFTPTTRLAPAHALRDFCTPRAPLLPTLQRAGVSPAPCARLSSPRLALPPCRARTTPRPRARFASAPALWASARPPAACASPTAPFTLAPRTPRLARTPRPRSPLRPRARALALVHRFAPTPYPRARAPPSRHAPLRAPPSCHRAPFRARPRARAPPLRTASLSCLASPPSRTLAPTRPAPRISPRTHAPHLASHLCPALPQRLASHPRARPTAHPHPASPSPPPLRSRTPLRFTASPHSRSLRARFAPTPASPHYPSALACASTVNSHSPLLAIAFWLRFPHHHHTSHAPSFVCVCAPTK